MWSRVASKEANLPIDARLFTPPFLRNSTNAHQTRGMPSRAKGGVKGPARSDLSSDARNAVAGDADSTLAIEIGKQLPHWLGVAFEDGLRCDLGGPGNADATGGGKQPPSACKTCDERANMLRELSRRSHSVACRGTPPHPNCCARELRGA